MLYFKKILLFGFFLLACSIFYFPEWQDFLQNQQEISKVEQKKDSALQQFSIENISPVIGDEIFFTPDKKLLDILVQKILNAEKRVYVNTYIFTEKRMREALLSIKSRGVDVKVILEKNVYKSPHLNDATYTQFLSGGIDVVWSDANDFSLNHAKYTIIDDGVYISTGNHSYSTFTKNTDIYIYVSQKTLVDDLETLFLGDFAGEKKFVYNHNLILSSFDAREKFTFLLKSANTYIHMYVPYMEDEQVYKILQEKLQENVGLAIITSKENRQSEWVQNLQNQGAKIHFSSTNIHAKSILVDGSTLYVGSTNFSFSSIEKNREVGLFLRNKEIVTAFQKYFDDDFIN